MREPGRGATVAAVLVSVCALVLSILVFNKSGQAQDSNYLVRAYIPMLACDGCAASSPTHVPAATATPSLPTGPTATATATRTATPTPTTTPTAVPAFASGPSAWYTSSAANAKYYYCSLDPQWKMLSPANLRSYATEAALLADWGGRRVKYPDSKC